MSLRWEITEAARRCKANRSIELYRMPVLYRDSVKLLSKRTINSYHDRVIGQWLMSCTGQRYGETISATGMDPVVEVEMRCCVVCGGCMGDS